jgi:hypothetical protein
MSNENELYTVVKVSRMSKRRKNLHKDKSFDEATTLANQFAKSKFYLYTVVKQFVCLHEKIYYCLVTGGGRCRKCRKLL